MARRFLCCTCSCLGESDDVEDSAYTYNKNRQHGRGKNSKKTWTRRRLLDNEDGMQDMVPIERIPYQMRALETPNSIPMTLHDDDAEIRKRLVAQLASRQRKSAQEVFRRQTSDSSTSSLNTTFPWMDEGFVPNARPGTRLGISSVQINAKRNMTNKMLNSSGDESLLSSLNNSGSAFKPYDKSLSFSGDDKSKPVFVNGNMRHYAASGNGIVSQQLKTVPNGTAVRASANNRYSIPGQDKVDGNASSIRQHVFRAPKSDVGVSRIMPANARHRPPDVIPRLDHYNVKKSGAIAADDAILNVQTTKVRRSVKELFPGTIDFSDESDGESSEYCGNLPFRSHHSDVGGRGFSLKQTPQPGIFSDGVKYDILKSNSTVAKRKSKKVQRKAESLYGYVPRAVTQVYASEALAGNQIDDFFRQRHNELLTSRLDSTKWTPIDKNDDVSVADEKPFVITAIVEDPDNSENVTHMADKPTSSETQRKHSGEESQIDGLFTNFQLQQLKPLTNGHANTNCAKKQDALSSVSNHKQDSSDNEIIMIDFPPNIDADRKRFSNVTSTARAALSDVSFQSTSSSTRLLGNVEVLY